MLPAISAAFAPASGPLRSFFQMDHDNTSSICGKIWLAKEGWYFASPATLTIGTAYLRDARLPRAAAGPLLAFRR